MRRDFFPVVSTGRLFRFLKITLNAKYFVLPFLVLLLGLSGCSNSGGGGDSRSSNEKSQVISGQVIKGVTANAEVISFQLDESGELVEMSRTLTNETGQFELPSIEPGPLLIKVQGQASLETRMICDAIVGCGRHVYGESEHDLNGDGLINFKEWQVVDEDFVLSAVVNVTQEPLAELTITPLTHAAAEYAMASELSAQSIETANNYLSRWSMMEGTLPFIHALDLTQIGEETFSGDDAGSAFKHALLSSAALGPLPLRNTAGSIDGVENFTEAFMDCDLSNDTPQFRSLFSLARLELRELGRQYPIPSTLLNQVHNELLHLGTQLDEPLDALCEIDLAVAVTPLEKVKKLVDEFQAILGAIDTNASEWEITANQTLDDVSPYSDRAAQLLETFSADISAVVEILVEYAESVDTDELDWEALSIEHEGLTVTSSTDIHEEDELVFNQEGTVSVRYQVEERLIELDILGLYERDEFEGSVSSPKSLRHASLAITGSVSNRDVRLEIENMTLALMSKERYEGDIGYSYYSYDDGFFFYPSFCQGYEGYNQCDGMGPIHMDLMWVDFYLAEPMLNESEAEEEGVDPIAHEQEQALNAFDYVVALDAHVALYVDLEGGVADQNAAEEADPLFSGNWHAMLAFEEESGNYDFITDNSVSFDLRFSPLSFSLDGTVMFPSSVGAAQSDSAADEEEALNRVTVSLTFSDIDGYNHYSRYHSYYGYSSESLDLNYSASVRLSVDLGLIGLPQVEASIHGGVDGYEYRNTYYPGYTSRYGYDEFFIYDGELQLSFDDSVISITQEDQGEETGLYTLRNGDNAQLSLNLSLTDQDESVGHLGLYNSDSDIYGYIYQANDSWLIRYSDGTFESLLPATVGQ